MIQIDVSFHSPQRGHNDTYQFCLDKDSLSISHLSKKATATNNEDPVWEEPNIEGIFSHDGIYVPAIFRDCIEHVWHSWCNGEIDDARAEKEFKELANWVDYTTSKRPQNDFWKKYF